jgi:biopolymer transport protein ExbD
VSASAMSSERVEPNLTPILDMVFQLITFFMLVVSFKSAALDLRLRLPVIGSARPVDTAGSNELLVLNVDADGRVIVYGEAKSDLKHYIQQEAQASLLLARQTRRDIQAGDELPTTVVIRADRDTPFQLLNRVLVVCQENGYRKFALKATTKQTG